MLHPLGTAARIRSLCNATNRLPAVRCHSSPSIHTHRHFLPQHSSSPTGRSSSRAHSGGKGLSLQLQPIENRDTGTQNAEVQCKIQESQEMSGRERNGNCEFGLLFSCIDLDWGQASFRIRYVRDPVCEGSVRPAHNSCVVAIRSMRRRAEGKGRGQATLHSPRP